MIFFVRMFTKQYSNNKGLKPSLIYQYTPLSQSFWIKQNVINTNTHCIRENQITLVINKNLSQSVGQEVGAQSQLAHFVPIFAFIIMLSSILHKVKHLYKMG